MGEPFGESQKKRGQKSPKQILRLVLDIGVLLDLSLQDTDRFQIFFQDPLFKNKLRQKVKATF